MRHSSLLLSAGCALVLSACGGGGGNPGSGTSTGAAPTPATQTSQLTPISVANAPGAAANGYAGTMLISESSSSVTGQLVGVSIAPAGIGAVDPVLQLVKRTYAQRTPGLLAGVVTAEACSGGGTVTLDAKQRNEQTVSNGDTVTVTARNCVENGEVLNGAFSVAVSEVTGDPVNTSSGSMTLATRFSNFSIVSGGETDTLNGDMKITLRASGGTSVSLAVSGASLQAGARIDNRALNVTLSNYDVAITVQGSTTVSTANFAITGNSSGVGQFGYTVKNLRPFVESGLGYPSAGALVVTGAGSSVSLDVLDGNNVRIAYSAKGDGTVTDSRTLTWRELLAAF